MICWHYQVRPLSFATGSRMIIEAATALDPSADFERVGATGHVLPAKQFQGDSTAEKIHSS